MANIDRKLRVFLCHAKEDKPTVRELYRQLTAEGWMDVWLDEVKLLPGQEWDIEIEKAVEQADVVVVCLSTHSVDKEGYVQKELRFVLNIADEKPEGRIFVIPLRLDDCQVPRRIRAWQYVDYFPKHNQKWAYQRLLESLKLRAIKFGISILSFNEPIHGNSEEFVNKDTNLGDKKDNVLQEKTINKDVPENSFPEKLKSGDLSDKPNTEKAIFYDKKIRRSLFFVVIVLIGSVCFLLTVPWSSLGQDWFLLIVLFNLAAIINSLVQLFFYNKTRQ